MGPIRDSLNSALEKRDPGGHAITAYALHGHDRRPTLKAALLQTISHIGSLPIGNFISAKVLHCQAASEFRKIATSFQEYADRFCLRYCSTMHRRSPRRIIRHENRAANHWPTEYRGRWNRHPGQQCRYCRGRQADPRGLP